MALTVGIVSFFLSSDYEVESSAATDEDFVIEGYRLVEGDGALRPALCLADVPPGPGSPDGGLCLVNLGPGPGVSSEGRPSLWACELSPRMRRRSTSARSADLADRVANAVQRHYRLEVAIARLCRGGTDFNEMLRLLELETGLVSLLVDKNLRYIARSPSFSGLNAWFSESDVSMDTDLVNELVADENFVDAINQRRAFYYHYAKEASYSACFNIVVDGSYEARLLVQSRDSQRRPGLLALAELVGQTIADTFALYSDAEAEASAKSDLQECVASLIKGQPAASDARRRLATAGWRPEHSYRVHVFSFMEAESESVTRRYYTDRIARLFERCCVLLEGDQICCVRNLSLETTRVDQAQQRMVLFLRENLCLAGTSGDFHDLNELHERYEEATSALRLGAASGSMEWLFRFGDFALDYIIDSATQKVSRSELIHPAWRALSDYDSQHGTELLTTARCFMEQRYNVSHAASELCIHRSSMLARLERIRDISGFDWESWDDRVHLAISFMLAEA